MKKIKTTYTNLTEFTEGFAKQKMFENGHKIDPLEEDTLVLFEMFKDECDEFKKAFRTWHVNKSPINAKKMMLEAGDIINNLKFITGVAAGFKNMERK